jgi:hypothetical protein
MATAARSPQTLQRLALTALELLDASLVAVLRLDEPHDRLVVETWVGGDGSIAHADAIPADGRWGRLLGGGPVSLSLSRDDILVRQLGLRPEPLSLFAAPLVFEDHPSGLLCCYALERRLLGEDNLALLGTIANHAAIALEQSRLAGVKDRGSRIRELFDSLRAGDDGAAAATELGVRLTDPHAVVIAEAESAKTATPRFAELAATLVDVFPGTLVDVRGALTALVPIRSERWVILLEKTMAEALGEGAVAGFSHSAGGDYALAFRQARMACVIARSSAPERRVRSYSGLGAQRYLWAISQERDPDPLELAVRRLVELDRKRGSELFRTLEVYLDRQGNARQTATALYVHRNTLRQRLRRIGEVLGLDPTDPAVAFDLALAVRLIRFREAATASTS